MSTFMPKADEIERKWYVIDAADKPLGRVAAEAATLLRGKHKPIFAPHVDCGDFVIIINTDKAVLTGDKLNKKLYQHHTGYIGRRAAFEILMVNREVRRLVNDDAAYDELLAAAKKNGYRTMRDSCREMVLRGVTTAEEASRTINSTLDE